MDYIRLGLYVATPLLIVGICVYLEDNRERIIKQMVRWLNEDEPIQKNVTEEKIEGLQSKL